MSYDLLLNWMSELGDGRWSQFRAAHEWLWPPSRRPGWATPSFAASILSMLGHIEFDWHEGRWAACPPVLTLLPSAGAHALCTGARTRTLEERLDRELADHPRIYPLAPIAQAEAPSARLIPCEEIADIKRLAGELGIEFSHSVSEDLSAALPPLAGYLEAVRTGPAPRGFGFTQFDVERLEWIEADSDDAPGFYSYDVPGPPLFRLNYGHGLQYQVDLAVGVWSALAQWSPPRLRWQQQSVNGELVVPLRAPLPTLHARSAALASGLAPMRRGKTLVYDNVPQRVARSIASSLGQELTVA